MNDLAFLSEIEALVDHDMRDGMNPHCPHHPTDKQLEFLNCDELEAMYGGAAGGGKSDALLMGAIQECQKPGASCLLLRRTFKDLMQPKAILDRAHEWLKGTSARWVASKMRYVFPTGSTISFGYFHHWLDRNQYASAEFTYIGWDELTQFPENWYTWMFSRLRKTKKFGHVKLKVRSATNPGNIGHAWVKRRFIDKITRKARFFPAFLTDNPYIDENYKDSLAKLDRATRNQLEKGVWEQDSSLLVYSFDPVKNLILTAPACGSKVLGIDYGLVNDACSWNILGWRMGDPTVYVLQSWKKEHVVPGEAARITKELESIHHFERMVGDAGGLGRAYTEEARKRWAIPVEHAEKTNKRGYIKLMNGELEESRIKIVESACKDLIDEYYELPWADETRMKEADAYPNHCADGTLYGWRAARAFLADYGLVDPKAVGSQFMKW